jgi:histone acetyltransferase (RNA polymerase elongator complex component)
MRFDTEDVKNQIESVLSSVKEDDECEIAFFGGSFTGIDFSLMTSLLDIAEEYVKSRKVKSIRCSTRPDYINEEILDTLKKYSVKVVELGLQSISEPVLIKTRRGHTALEAERAVSLLKEYGFKVSGQMMIGLPSSKLGDEIATARFIVESGCDMARIYPTVVFRDTELCRMADTGDYKPLTLKEAVERSAKALSVLVSGGVEVIRIGLCDSENLHSDSTYYAGPNHPAIGEMVISRYYLEKITEGIKEHFPSAENINIFVSQGSVSKAVGQNKSNKRYLYEALGIKNIKISESPSLCGYEVLLEKDGKKICI